MHPRKSRVTMGCDCGCLEVKETRIARPSVTGYLGGSVPSLLHRPENSQDRPLNGGAEHIMGLA